MLCGLDLLHWRLCCCFCANIRVLFVACGITTVDVYQDALLRYDLGRCLYYIGCCIFVCYACLLILFVASGSYTGNHVICSSDGTIRCCGTILEAKSTTLKAVFLFLCLHADSVCFVGFL